MMCSNSVGLTDTNMWFPIAGSGATNQITTTLDSSRTNVFFRLQVPITANTIGLSVGFPGNRASGIRE